MTSVFHDLDYWFAYHVQQKASEKAVIVQKMLFTHN